MRSIGGVSAAFASDRIELITKRIEFIRHHSRRLLSSGATIRGCV
jgi:hypothetical protein